jgi:hydroxymethylpyrimidine/phosphomethylpyrimidine kinase
MSTYQIKNVLSIAGSDSSGGAGIQADLKTMCALGVYGMTVITSVTAQNTTAVTASQDIAPEIVAAQIEAVFDDIRVDAVKIGMVSSVEIIRVIKEELLKYRAVRIVVDPVMVSKTGYALLKPDAENAIMELCAIADVITPNIPEAEILAGFPVKDKTDMERAAKRIAAGGVKNVLIKGGHFGGDNSDDLLLTDGRLVEIKGARVNTKNTHGTGCTLSSAIASRLALGDSTEDAVRFAKKYVTRAIKDNYAVGRGCGPVGHLTELYRRAGMLKGDLN